MKKSRIDELLVERGFATNIDEARRIIMSGVAIADDKRIDKAGEKVSGDAIVRLKGEHKIYVSRGGFKLKGAVDSFKLNMKDATVLDIGSSTGGFTDVALKEGAAVVFALDVGKGLIHESLRTHEKVRLLEGVNFRDAAFEIVGQKVDFIVTDVSFISLKLIIPATIKFCLEGTCFICLIKPQFEVDRNEVGVGGIVTDKEATVRVCKDIIDFAAHAGLNPLGFVKSPITGAKGNVEYLVHLVYSGSSHQGMQVMDIRRIVCEERRLDS